jgi:hypothetical protein
VLLLLPALLRVITAALDAAIERALRSLPPGDAATLRAWAGDERPQGVAPATFRKRVERGLVRLRRALGARERGGER